MSDPSAQLETMKQQVLRMNAAQRKAFVRKLEENPALAQQANQFLGPVVLQFLYQDENQNLIATSSNSIVANFRGNNQRIRRSRGKGRASRLNQTLRGPDEARKNLYRIKMNELLKIPCPKSILNEINFIPRFDKNFCYLVGLDLVVQQMKNDESVFEKYEESPYACEECGIDFTPSWKAVGEDVNHLHLYCETCFRQSQKRKIISHQTAVLRRAFSRNANEEMELEKDIAAGKGNKNNRVIVSQGPRAGPSFVPIVPKPKSSDVPGTSAPDSVKHWRSLKFQF